MSDQASFMSRLCMGEILEDRILPFPEMKQEERETLETVLGSLKQLL